MSGRETILGNLRRSLGRAENDSVRQRVVEQRLSEAPAGLIPARAQLSHKEQVELFRKMAEEVNASVVRVKNPAEVPAAVSDYLRGKNLPSSIVHGADKAITGLPWDKAANLERKTEIPDGSEAAGLSHAKAGVAETGTLALCSGPDNPSTINFLPDHHIVMIDAKDIVGDYETAIAKIREIYGKGHMPRTLNFVTGPSRSADIEQTLLLGAHGPRALHIIIVG